MILFSPMKFGSIYSRIDPRDKHIIHFEHGNFNMVFRYEDSILNNYDMEISLCCQIVCCLENDNLAEGADWIFSFNDTLVPDDDYEGLICKKVLSKIQFGMTGNYPGNCCFLEISVDDIEARHKIAEFYNKIMDLLIEKREGSIGRQLTKWFR